MKKIIVLFVLLIVSLFFTGCIKNSIIVKKPQEPDKVVQPTLIQKKSELTKNSYLEDEVWNKIKLLYIDIDGI